MLDRLSRNAAFVFTLKDSGVDFVCDDMPDANTLTIGILAVLVRHESVLVKLDPGKHENFTDLDKALAHLAALCLQINQRSLLISFLHQIGEAIVEQADILTKFISNIGIHLLYGPGISAIKYCPYILRRLRHQGF